VRYAKALITEEFVGLIRVSYCKEWPLVLGVRIFSQEEVGSSDPVQRVVRVVLDLLGIFLELFSDGYNLSCHVEIFEIVVESEDVMLAGILETGYPSIGFYDRLNI
jgi:hypothetical protein